MKDHRFIFWVLVGLLLVTSLSYAWSSVWNGTSWITDGGTIDAQKIAENFEYLKARVNDSTGFGTPPVCVGTGRVIQWTGTQWSCMDTTTNTQTPVSLVGGTHTSANCTAIGGNVTNTVDGYICKVSGASCTTGWVQHNQWSSTNPATASWVSTVCMPYTCTTASHAFSNIGREQCTYYVRRTINGDGDYNCDARIMSANVTEIGCK